MSKPEKYKSTQDVINAFNKEAEKIMVKVDDKAEIRKNIWTMGAPTYWSDLIRHLREVTNNRLDFMEADYGINGDLIDQRTFHRNEISS